MEPIPPETIAHLIRPQLELNNMYGAITCDTGEEVGTYSEYLNTAHWRSVRERAFEYWGKSCASCNKTGVRLDMHHLTYVRVGRENIYMDLCPLCRDCHISEHLSHPYSRKLLESSDNYLELGEEVRLRILSKLNDKWLKYEHFRGEEMRRWFETEKPAILTVIRNNHYNSINHNLQLKYSDGQYAYIYKDSWFLEMMIRKGVSCGSIRPENKRSMILSVYRKHDALERLRTPD